MWHGTFKSSLPEDALPLVNLQATLIRCKGTDRD